MDPLFFLQFLKARFNRIHNPEAMRSLSRPIQKCWAIRNSSFILEGQQQQQAGRPIAPKIVYVAGGTTRKAGIFRGYSRTNRILPRFQR
jgi:hypothetical protein